MRNKEDSLGLPEKNPRGRPVNLLKFRGKARIKTYKRIRGAWPEAIENMRVGDCKTVSVHFSHEDYDAKKAIEVLERESRAIKKAMNRVRNQRPEIRLRQFRVDRSDIPGAKFSHIVSTTLTRTA